MGVSATTGRPLAAELEDNAVESMLTGSDPKEALKAFSEKAGDAEAQSFAVGGEFEADELDQVGWGVIFAPGVRQEIKDALKPLLDHRKQQAKPYVVYEGEESVLPGESAKDWLTRHGVSWVNPVNPDKGVPYFLMLVGPINEIPFEFQYALDLNWAVGRLWFDTADEFRQYATSVIQYETEANKPAADRTIAMFATEHDFDNATQQFMRHVAAPLRDGAGNTPVPLGTRQRFSLRTVLGQDASKSALHDLMTRASSKPSVLFTGSHGMQFDNGDPRQSADQGAIVCGEWDGYGAITEQHWFSAADVPGGAKLDGLIHFFFACHGGGCPSVDNFDRLNGQPKQIAPEPFFARLPQRMLAHPNGGALAVVAHVERAWAYSFLGSDRSSQPESFRDVLSRIMRGQRIGYATDTFNTRWANLSIDLAELHLKKEQGGAVALKALGKLWIARDDARNFIILGDPAVRLRVQDMAAGA